MKKPSALGVDTQCRLAYLPFTLLLVCNIAFADEQNQLLQSSTNVNSVPAKIMSLQDSWVSAEIAANIDEINVDVGDKITRNSILAKLDCREYTIRQNLALAEINSLKARLPGIEARIEAAKSDVAANLESVSLFNTQAKAAKASVVAGKADINRIKAQSKADQAKCNLARIDLKRAQDLGKRQLISQQEVDKALTEYQAAQAECSAIQPEIASANAKTQSLQANANAATVATKVQQAKTKMASSNIKVQEAEIPALNAQIAAAEAKLQTEALMVSRCELKAPFDGEIIERKVQKGQRIAVGENAFRVLSLQEREVSASVSQAELQAIKVAKSLSFGTPQEKLPIRYRAAVGMLDGEARTREVRFTFEENNSLPIGLSGRVIWENQ